PRSERKPGPLTADPERRTAGEAPTAKQVPHQPGVAPAFSVRAGNVGLFVLPQAASSKEIWPCSPPNVPRRGRHSAPRPRGAAASARGWRSWSRAFSSPPAFRVGPVPEPDLLALDEAMTRLAADDPPRAQLVRLRFYA